MEEIKTKYIRINTLPDDIKELNINIKITADDVPELVGLCNDRSLYRNKTNIKCHAGCGMQGKPVRGKSSFFLNVPDIDDVEIKPRTNS